MMIKSADVHPGDPIAARDRATVLEDLRSLDQRIAAIEAISGPGAWQNCLNCLSEVFFWGIGEVTSDDGDDTYTLKPKYISNSNTTTTDAMTTGDMDTGDGIKPAITATAVGTGAVTVGDEFLVFGGFDAGEDAGEPIARCFFEARGAAEPWQPLENIVAGTTAQWTAYYATSVLGYEVVGSAFAAERRLYARVPPVGGVAQTIPRSDVWAFRLGWGDFATEWWDWLQYATGPPGSNLTASIYAGYVTTAIPDVINWAAQPTVIGEAEVYRCASPAAVGLGVIHNHFYQNDDVAIYGIRLRCNLAPISGATDYYWWENGLWHSPSPTVFYRGLRE